MPKLILHPEFKLYERKDKPLCTSLQVAETFEKEHRNILRDIEKIFKTKGTEDFSQLNFERTYYLDTQNKKRPMYLMTKDGFTLLVMGYSGEKAMKFKIAYIQRFNDYEQQIKNYIESREDFAPFTRAIQDSHEIPKSHHFSNEMNMINRIVLGMDAKHFKELHGLGEVQSIRPFLNQVQIRSIRKLQIEDIPLLYRGVSYGERKNALNLIYQQKILEG